ncbi:alpha/beta hydrolase [Bradyrhizobium sp. CCBAU 11434]|uniref:Alpha/beta hydrolase n=1 Tax=Bradyrhizobium zhengyangense TaxID=2911009 RepID=A0ABS9LMQ3_9BRAD|nr:MULTISPECIES: alpha/beta hydrolase [Bradyrhizobium]MCG2668294.1 alpha/beta hydrolase [Bradyrhizobium zhengyangense]MDA9521313.1 alpha/beta hydrolase [Bradyrhizobium sp. CCBAU 11434]
MSRPATVDFLQIGEGIELRRTVVRNEGANGIVFLLHGFPETLYAWQGVVGALAGDYEVHALDWPGYGFSSRPTVDRFPYSPADYAQVLDRYIQKTGIEPSRLVIYATDIGALPALLLAVKTPTIARKIIVGDFAPFNRPQFMYAGLQGLKTGPAMEQVRANMNGGRDQILESAFTMGLPKEAHFEVAADFKDDMLRGWSHGPMTPVDAFSQYYSHFTRDQDYFESKLADLTTPVKVIWGEDDFFINKEMGVELAKRLGTQLKLLRGIGHYPHLQNPKLVAGEIRTEFE